MKANRPRLTQPGEVLIYPCVLRQEIEELGVEAAVRQRMSQRFEFIEVLTDNLEPNTPQVWVQCTVKAKVKKDD
jgi:hypothetical protein